MSDLHFDADGEPAKVPADAEELRVRRFRKPGERGACEVVHGGDGAPLYIPIDTSHLELRKLVDGVPGRYRLDPVDAGRRPCSGAVPLYATIDPARNAAGSGDDRDCWWSPENAETLDRPVAATPCHGVSAWRSRRRGGGTSRPRWR